jgi:hypothetical protein
MAVDVSAGDAFASRIATSPSITRPMSSTGGYEGDEIRYASSYFPIILNADSPVAIAPPRISSACVPWPPAISRHCTPFAASDL